MMIWESYVWKDDLLQRADKLERRRRQKRWTDHSMGLAEQEIMVGFFSIRKLVESHKVSDLIAKKKQPVDVVPAIGAKRVTLLNHHRLDQLFDFDKQKRKSRRLSEISNQVIHSMVFALTFNEDTGGLDGFIVASDWKKDDHALIVSTETTVEVFREVGNNDPGSIQMIRNAAGDMEVSVGL